MAVTADEGFRQELESLINRYSMESGSDTPDFILAEFLTDSLAAYDKAVTRRTKWFAPPMVTVMTLPEDDPNAYPRGV